MKRSAIALRYWDCVQKEDESVVVGISTLITGENDTTPLSNLRLAVTFQIGIVKIVLSVDSCGESYIGKSVINHFDNISNRSPFA